MSDRDRFRSRSDRDRLVPTKAQIEHGKQERTANEIARRMQEKWEEDALSIFLHDLDSATIIPDGPQPPQPYEPTVESLLHDIGFGFRVEQRAIKRKRGRVRGLFKCAKIAHDAARTPIDPARGRRTDAAVRAISAAMHDMDRHARVIAEYDAEIARIEAAAAAREAEVRPIVEAALRGEDGWRVVRGYICDAKGRRLQSQRSWWEHSPAKSKEDDHGRE